MKAEDLEFQKTFEALAVLKDVPTRDEKEAQKTRARFLIEVDSLTSSNVSADENLRHINWIQKLVEFMKVRKEFAPMLTQIVTAFLVVATLIAGVGGSTVYASQSATPESMLYPVKIWSEDTRLNISKSAEEQLDLSLAFANRRVDELVNLEEDALGQIDDEDVSKIQSRLLERLQLHIEQAFECAAEVENPEMAMSKLQSHLQTQTMLLQKEAQNNNPDLEQIMLQTLQMLQERLRWVNEELEPQHLQQQNQTKEQNQINLMDKTPMGTPQSTGEGPHGPSESNKETPGPQHGTGPSIVTTPTTTSQMGPGMQTETGMGNGQPYQSPSEPNGGKNESGSGGKSDK